MAKPHVHAEAHAKKFGGKSDDYVSIDLLLDSCRTAMADNRARALTHHSWFIREILPKIFGHTFVNSDDKVVSTIDVAENHVQMDFNGFVPSAQDFLQEIEFLDWMNNGQGTPPSYARIVNRKKYRIEDVVVDTASRLRID